MKCIHPHKHTYFDPVSGKSHTIEIPCGKCVACLHNEQDSWAVRIQETAKHAKGIIYDTLTFRPGSIACKDVYEEAIDVERKIRNDSWKLLRFYDFLLPCLTRDVIRDWVKRGRENYFLDHGERLNIKYFMVEEYGPKTSRPHVHLLMFNISYSDYMTYFGNPWQEDFGFTKTVCLSGKGKKMADRVRVSRYVSKYVSKGVFESPLVKDGFLPKPFRCISHGIGLEYLDRSKFDPFKSAFALFWKGFSNKSCDTLDLQDCCKFGTVPDLSLCKGINVDDPLGVYYDDRGYLHALPRYYRQKLLKLCSPNLFSCAVQDRVRKKKFEDDFSLYCNAALNLGLDVSNFDLNRRHFGLNKKDWINFYKFVLLVERQNVRFAAKQRYIKLKNHYGRIVNSDLDLYK